MDLRLFLSKIIMLIYRSRELGMTSYDTLIENSLEDIKINNKDNGFTNVGMTKKLMNLVFELITRKDKIDLDSLLVELELTLDNDIKLYKTIARTLSKELEEDEIKKQIGSLSAEISQFTRYEKVKKIVSTLSYNLNHSQGSITDAFNSVRDSMAEIEPFTMSGENELEEGIVTELRLKNRDDFKDVLEEVRNRMLNTGIYKTGWHALNRMLQGGLRPGEVIGLHALQHNYKTSGSQSIFGQIVTLNNPIMRKEDEGKRPLAIYFYLEDSLENGIQFFYQYFKANDGIYIKPEDIENTPVDELSEYITNRMESKGFEIALLKVNPSDFTFTSLFSYLLKLESQGYTIRVAFIDYLLMMNCAGCAGKSGLEKKDLLRRVSNFFRARHTVFLTPVQLDNYAMQLIKDGTTGIQFLKAVAGKNYTAESKQISHEFDAELYLAIHRVGEKAFLCFGRGKHRVTTQVESEEHKFFALPFKGPNIPVLEDIYATDTSTPNIPRGNGGMSMDEGFLDDLF